MKYSPFESTKGEHHDLVRILAVDLWKVNPFDHPAEVLLLMIPLESEADFLFFHPMKIGRKHPHATEQLGGSAPT